MYNLSGAKSSTSAPNARFADLESCTMAASLFLAGEVVLADWQIPGGIGGEREALPCER